MAKRERPPTSEEIFGSFFSPGSFFMFPKLFMFMMQQREAILLSFLIGFYSWLKCSGQLKGEWFYCTAKRIESELNLGEMAQKRTLRGLRSLGFITTEKRGMPPSRYIHLEKDIIVRRVLSARRKHDAKYREEDES